MTIDFSKLVTAADKAEQAAQQAAQQAEQDLRVTLRAALIAQPLIAEIRVMTAEQFDLFLAIKLGEFTPDQQPVIESLMRFMFVMVREIG